MVSRKLIPFLKWVLVIATFVLLYRNQWIENPLPRLKILPEVRFYFFAAFGCFVLSSLTAFWRWSLLLKDLDLHKFEEPLWKAHWIGLFFNIALPGAVSGDFIKAYRISRQGFRTTALSSILLDRIYGISGIIFLSFISLAIGSSSKVFSTHPKLLWWIVLPSTLGIITFFILLKFKNPPIIGWILKKSQRVDQLWRGLQLMQNSLPSILRSLSLSVFIQATSALGFYFFDVFWNLDQAQTLAFYGSVVPIGFLVTAIPILPGGVGTGHYAFQKLFSWGNLSTGASSFSLFFISQLIIALPGVFLFLWHRSRNGYGNAVKLTSST